MGSSASTLEATEVYTPSWDVNIKLKGSKDEITYAINSASPNLVKTIKNAVDGKTVVLTVNSNTGKMEGSDLCSYGTDGDLSKCIDALRELHDQLESKWKLKGSEVTSSIEVPQNVVDAVADAVPHPTIEQ